MATAADRAYETLKDSILTGEVATGSWLRESELAARIGGSRTPIREAIRRLHADGLVDVQPHRGARVLGWNAEDVDDLFALRAVLEGYGAGLAAIKITPEALESLREQCVTMENVTENPSAELDTLMVANRNFHSLIVNASGSQRLPSLVAAVTPPPPLSMATYARFTAEALRRTYAQHREIANALAARDAEWARAAMISHILAGRRSIDRWL